MSQVVIGDILPYTQATAISNQTVFGTNWTADTESDVVVYVRAAGSTPNDATQILSYPSQYSVAFIGALQQVQVTLVTPSTAGDIVTITRQTPADRLNLYSNTNFVPSMLNNDFGILTLVDQQAQLVNQKIGPRYNYCAVITDIIDTILPILPANSFWAKNQDNTAIIAVDINDIISGGTVTQIDTGLGLTGGPITNTGTISFAPMTGNTFWGNITPISAVPTEVSTDFFLQSAKNLIDLTNPATARINLGVEIGVNVEAWSAALDSIAGLTTTANELIYTTASNTYATIASAINSTLITDALGVPSLAQTLPAAVQSNITQLGTQTQNLNMGTHKITNVVDPTNPQDAATRFYVDAQTANFLPITGGTMQGAIDMGNHKISNITDPTLNQDAVTLSYLNTAIGSYLPLSGGTMTGAINMGSHKITSVTDPTNPQDAATKNYVDSVATGFAVQPAVYAASTTALTVTYSNGASGIGATLTNAGAFAVFSIDGVNPTTNDRVLIKDQSTTYQNGIYTVTNVGDNVSVNWVLTRATDYDQPAEIQPGDLIVINNGSTLAGTSFIETASVAAVGTDPILFSQFTFSATAVLLKANNLSDVANTTTSFNNISPLTTKGDLLTYNSGNVRLGVGSNSTLLQADSGAATGLAWTTATYPTTTTANQILYSSATNTITGLASTAGGVLVTDASSVPQFLANPSASGKLLASANAAIPIWTTPTYPTTSGTAGKVIISDGTNNVYSTPTFPNASATIRKIIVSDGTNWVASTETYATPGTSGNVLTSDGTNWVSSAPASSGTVSSGALNSLAYYTTNPTGTTVGPISVANSSVLVTSAGGVPSLSTTLPAGLTIPGYAASGANADITSMTGLTGYLQHPTGIKDSNGNIVCTFVGVASAVDYLTFTNSTAAAVSPTIGVAGSDTNINLNFAVKGSAAYNFTGNSSIQAVIRLFENSSNGTNYVGLKAPASLAGNQDYILPSSDGSVGQVMRTDGSGNLSFVFPAVTQIVTSYVTGTSTSSAVIPFDNTIPQNTEGGQLVTATITPKIAGSTLQILFVCPVSNGGTAQAYTSALFLDSGANALAANGMGSGSAAGVTQTNLLLNYTYTTTGTSAITFKIRVGGNTSATSTYGNPGYSSAAFALLMIIEYNI